MYPVGMALPPARAGVEPEPIYFLFEDDFCKGHEQRRDPGPSSEWRGDQGVEEREELEAGFREIVSHPWFIGGRQLDPKRMEMFYTACYDLDTFRRFVFESTFLEAFRAGGRAGRAAARRTTRRCCASPSAGCASPCSPNHDDGARATHPQPRRNGMTESTPQPAARRRGGDRRRDRRPRGGRGRPRGRAGRDASPPSAAACCAATTTSPSSARRSAAWRSTPGAWSATRASGCSPSTQVTGRGDARRGWSGDGHAGRRPTSTSAAPPAATAAKVCPVKVPDPFNLGMSEVPAIRLPYPNAWPHRFVLDREACPTAARPASTPASTTPSTSTPSRARGDARGRGGGAGHRLAALPAGEAPRAGRRRASRT